MRGDNPARGALLVTGIGGFLFWPLWLGLAAIVLLYLAAGYHFAWRKHLTLSQRLLFPVAALVTHAAYAVGETIGFCRLPFYTPRSFRPEGSTPAKDAELKPATS